MSLSSEYEYKTAFKYKWKKVFFHRIINGVQFDTIDEARFIVNNEDKYSILNKIKNSERIENGKFVFMIEFDGAQYTMWKQTNSPLNEEENESCTTQGACFVKGFELIKSNINDNSFGGLAVKKRQYSGCFPSLIAGTIFSERWYYSIGMTSTCNGHWTHTTLPAQLDKSTYATTLWMKVPFINHFSCRTKRSSRLIIYTLIAIVS